MSDDINQAISPSALEDANYIEAFLLKSRDKMVALTYPLSDECEQELESRGYRVDVCYGYVIVKKLDWMGAESRETIRLACLL